MRFPQGAEWLIILVLILLLFGAKRLPDMARSLGRSARILKSETKGLRDEDSPAEGTTDAAAPQAALPPAAPDQTPAAVNHPTQPGVPNPVAEAVEGQTKPGAS